MLLMTRANLAYLCGDASERQEERARENERMMERERCRHAQTLLCRNSTENKSEGPLGAHAGYSKVQNYMATIPLLL